MSCAKVAFNTHEQARAASRRMATNHGSAFQVYRCLICGNWHIGGVHGKKSQKAYESKIKRKARGMKDARNIQG